MSTNWRISTFNGVLLAAYFIPTWTIVAFKIVISPMHGLYERANLGCAVHQRSSSFGGAGHRSLRLAAGARQARRRRHSSRCSWCSSPRASIRKAGGCDEALGSRCSAASSASPAWCWPRRSARPRRCGCTRPNCCCCSAAPSCWRSNVQLRRDASAMRRRRVEANGRLAGVSLVSMDARRHSAPYSERQLR